MPGPFAPTDDLIGPISQQIATLISVQIPSIQYVYTRMPDKPPGDNSVVLRLVDGMDIDETSGKIKLKITFRASHIFRRAKIGDTFARAYTYVTPWLKFLAAWQNQQLGGLSMAVTTKRFNVMQIPQSGQSVVALLIDFQVLTEFNIPLT